VARRPAILERAGAQTPRDRVWAAIRCFGASDIFSIVEVVQLSGQHVDTVLTYVEALERGNYLECVDAARRPACRPHKMFGRLRLLRDTGVDAPRVKSDGAEVEQGAGRQQMWNVLRKERGDFNWRDLAHRASTRHHPVAEREARDYARALRLAGYLRLVAPARRGRGNAPERLQFLRLHDTGPRAPLITRAKQVLDANTGAIVYDPKARGDRNDR